MILRQPTLLAIILVMSCYTVTFVKNHSVQILPNWASAAPGTKKKVAKVVEARKNIAKNSVKSLKVTSLESMKVVFKTSAEPEIQMTLTGKGYRYLNSGDKFSDWLVVKTSRRKMELVPAVTKDLELKDLWANEDELVLTIVVPDSHKFLKVEVESVNGDVAAENLVADKINFQIVSGDIGIKGGSTKDVKIESVSGDLALENLDLKNANLKTVSGDIVIQSKELSPSYRFKTVSGDLQLTLPAKAAFKVDFESMTGELFNQFTKVEGGFGKVEFSSLSGDAEIRKPQ